MTWGSNASFSTIRCPYCRGDMIDDRDSGPTTHMLVCSRRPWWRKLLALLPAPKGDETP